MVSVTVTDSAGSAIATVFTSPAASMPKPTR